MSYLRLLWRWLFRRAVVDRQDHPVRAAKPPMIEGLEGRAMFSATPGVAAVPAPGSTQTLLSQATTLNDVGFRRRDIEGRNPLYLPQAKTYDRSCSLGP